MRNFVYFKQDKSKKFIIRPIRTKLLKIKNKEKMFGMARGKWRIVCRTEGSQLGPLVRRFPPWLGKDSFIKHNHSYFSDSMAELNNCDTDLGAAKPKHIHYWPFTEK